MCRLRSARSATWANTNLSCGVNPRLRQSATKLWICRFKCFEPTVFYNVIRLEDFESIIANNVCRQLVVCIDTVNVRKLVGPNFEHTGSTFKIQMIHFVSIKARTVYCRYENYCGSDNVTEPGETWLWLIAKAFCQVKTAEQCQYDQEQSWQTSCGRTIDSTQLREKRKPRVSIYPFNERKTTV